MKHLSLQRQLFHSSQTCKGICMLNKSILVSVFLLLSCGFLVISLPAPQSTDEESKSESAIKSMINKIGVGEKAKIMLKNGTMVKGYISKIGIDSFTLVNSKTNATLIIAYRDVKQDRFNEAHKSRSILLYLVLGSLAIGGGIVIYRTALKKRSTP